MRNAAVSLWLGLVLAVPPVTAGCPGDCDGDGTVVVAEVLAAVGAALGTRDVEGCAAADADGDGRVSIADILRAVRAVLFGCPTPPTATPTVTPTPLAGPECGNGVAEPPEACDDGNRTSGDGCDARCQLEPGGDVCAGVPTVRGTELRAFLVADGLTEPVAVTAPPLDPRRVFVVERPGRIRVVTDGVLRPEPFLDIADRVTTGFVEQGLLGLAFHPRYEQTGWFFVDYTDRNGDTVVARYQVSADPERADPASERVLLRISQPFPNHNGGQLAFGPDGMLYVGMGDGGAAFDPFGNAQNDASLLGKLLRLDVDVPAAPYFRVPADNPQAAAGVPLGLVWAKGLRNPWRFSFDRETGDLYIGDVGQNAWEEIDVAPAGSGGGRNYGWDFFEGRHCPPPEGPPVACPDPDGFVSPVLEYDHGAGCSVTGGYVYRGCAMPDLRGTYFYGDFCSAFIRSFRLVGGEPRDERDWTTTLRSPGVPPITQIASFGEDARGELYVCDLSGRLFRLGPALAGSAAGHRAEPRPSEFRGRRRPGLLGGAGALAGRSARALAHGR